MDAHTLQGIVYLVLFCAAGGPAPEKKAVEKAVSDVEAVWGIRPLGIRLAAGNHFLDFRYLVTDGRKAAAVCPATPMSWERSRRASCPHPSWLGCTWA